MLLGPIAKALAFIVSFLMALVPGMGPAPEAASLADHESLAPVDVERESESLPPLVPADDSGFDDSVPVAADAAESPPPPTAADESAAAEPDGEVALDVPAPAPPPAPFAIRFRTPVLDGAAGEELPFTLTVENREPRAITVTLAIKDVTPGWRATAREGAIELAPDERIDVPVTLAAPADAAGGSEGRVRVEVVSFSPVVAEIATATVAIPPAEGVRAARIAVPTPSQYVAPGGAVEYDVLVRNTGDAPDVFTLIVSPGPGGWSGTLSGATVSLEPGEEKRVVLTVTAPGEAADGEASWFNLTLKPRGLDTVVASASTLTVVDAEDAGSPVPLDVVCVDLPSTTEGADEAGEPVCVDLRALLPPIPDA